MKEFLLSLLDTIMIISMFCSLGMLAILMIVSIFTYYKIAIPSIIVFIVSYKYKGKIIK